MFRKPAQPLAPGDSPETEPWSSVGASPGPTTGEVKAPQIGRYTVLGELGRGGMGVVYRALDRTLDREVALKVMAGDLFGDDDARRRILREARACAQLHHENLITVLDAGEEQSRVYFTMPLLPGPSLAERIRDGGRLSPGEAVSVAVCLARALQHVHERGLIHRDVKPGNVLFDGERPVLTDFGLVKFSDAKGTELTRSGRILGTFAYMAPELLERGAGAASPQSDQYALGALLYRCLSGRVPYPGNNPVELVANLLSGPPERLERFGVPPALARLTHRALAHQPGDRFPDMNAFADALSDWEGDSSLISVSRDLSRRIREQFRRPTPGLQLLAGALLVSLLAWGGWLARQRWAEESAERRREAMEERVAALRLAGDAEDAERNFRSFASFEANQGTRALTRAWLHRARELQRDGDHPEAAGEAWTMAWVLAEDAEDQGMALLGLAEMAAAASRWSELEAILRLPEARGGADRASRAADAAARMDLSGAAALSEGAIAPVLRALSAATPLHQSASVAAIFPGEPDGVLLYDTARGLLSLRELSPGARLLATGTAPYVHNARSTLRVVPSEGERPSSVIVGNPETCELKVRQGDALVGQGSWPCHFPVGATQFDTDGDGVREGVLADDFRLLRLDPDGEGGWGPRDVYPASHGIDSVIRVILPYTSGGRSMLAMAIAGWNAYEVRLLAPVDGRLALISRDRLGAIAALATLERGGEPLLAAYQAQSPDVAFNTRVFPNGPPYGEERGIYLLSMEGDNLVRRDFLELPPQGRSSISVKTEPDPQRPSGYDPELLMGGDIDGDGEDELIFGLTDGAGLVVYARDPALGWQRSLVRSLKPLVMADIDGDGDEELLVRDTFRGSQLWWLGSGGEALEILHSLLPDPKGLPAGLPAPDRSRWRRVERLVAVGLVEEAVARLSELALARAGSPTEGLAWRRVGEIQEQLGENDAAARSFLLAANSPALAPAALESALRCLGEAGRADEALAAMRRRLALPDPPAGLAERALALEQQLAGPVLRGDFSREIPPGWWVESPLGLRFQPNGGGLRLSLAAGEDALSLPLRREAGRTRIALGLDPLRLDWSYELQVRLRWEEGDRYMGWQSSGGGGVHRWRSFCGTTGQPIDWPDISIPEILRGGPWTLIYEQLDGDDGATCTLMRGEQEVGRARVLPIDLPPPGTPIQLQVRAHAREPFAGEAVLRSLDLRGFALDPQPPPPEQAIYALMLSGRLSEAKQRLEALDSSGAELSLARALLAEDLGEPEQARRALARALQLDPRLGGALDGLLLLHPARLRAALRATLGAGLYGAIADAFHGQFYSSTVGIDTDPTLLDLLADLDAVVDCCLPPGQARWLSLQRAAALRRAGRDVLAGAGLRRALAMDPSQDREPVQSLLYVELARTLANTGQDDAALDALLSALDASPTPELLADRLDLDPIFAALRQKARWVSVWERRRVAPPGSTAAGGTAH